MNKPIIKTKTLKTKHGSFTIKIREKEYAKCSNCGASIVRTDILHGYCSKCKKSI